MAGNKYTADTYRNRTQDQLKDGLVRPSAAGPQWEGTFTIPVCDVSGIIPDKVVGKRQVILQPYGKGKIPTWCKPMCTGPDGKTSKKLTEEFIEVAQMKNFDSPTAYCPGEGWQGWPE